MPTYRVSGIAYMQRKKRGKKQKEHIILHIYMVHTCFFQEGRRSVLASDFPCTSEPIIEEREFVGRPVMPEQLMTTNAPHPATVGVVLKRARHARSFFPRKLRIRRPRDEWRFHKAISAVRYQFPRRNRHGATRLCLRYDFPAIRNALQSYVNIIAYFKQGSF